jgi:plasmid stabilization system protein ParE
MWPVRFLSEVESDLDEAVAWYDRAGESRTADAFLAEFRGILGTIAAHGQVFRRQPSGFRYLNLKRFPYLVFYRDEGDGFVVVLVVNAARNPALIRTLLGQRRPTS